MTTAVRKRPRRLKVYQRITPEDGGLLFGLREIQQYMRLSVSTIRKLRIKHGLPLIKGNDGKWFVSKSILDTWMLAIWRDQLDQERQRIGALEELNA